MSRVPKLLSIIIPAYHQEKTIKEDIAETLIALSHLEDVAFEVIVVIDGTRADKTFERAKDIRKGNYRVVGYEHNRGKGYAVRYGMARSQGDLIAFIDAGSDIKPEGISMMMSHFRWYNADIVIGSKRHPVSKVNYPWYRKILSFGYQVLIKVLFGLSIRDSQVGLKVFRREVLEDVLPRLLVKRFAFDIEMLAVAHHLGYTRIFEAPVELDFTGVSTITTSNFWRSVWNMLWDTLAVFYRLRILRYYDTSNKRRWRYDPELDMRVNLP